MQNMIEKGGRTNEKNVFKMFFSVVKDKRKA